MVKQRQNASSNKDGNPDRGLAGLNDGQRRNLVNDGDRAPTGDQRQSLRGAGSDSNGRAKPGNQGSALDRAHQR